MPWDRVAGQQPVEPIGCTQRHGRFEIEVRDPNQDGKVSKYVVLREDSRYRVDLIESTRYNHREVALPGPAMRYVPAPLTAEQIEQARAHEAAMAK